VTEELTYEQAVGELDRRLRALEEGKLSLEDSLKAYDEARAYLKQAEAKLEAARKRIEVRGETPAQTAAEAAREDEDRLL
jgi:exodeoxyribonuclease VII small subunit